MNISLTTRWGKSKTPFLDAIEAMERFANEQGVCLNYCEVDKDQWKKLIDEMWGSMLCRSVGKGDWLASGEAFIGSVKVVCPEVRDAQIREAEIRVTWDGSNIGEVTEALERAFIVKDIHLNKRDMGIKIKLERVPYDPAPDKTQTLRVGVGDTVKVSWS